MRSTPLENHVIVIVGGEGLLGQAFSDKVVRDGAVCVSADVTVQDGDASDSLASGGAGRLIRRHVDITAPESVTALLEFVKKEFDRVDAVVNNAYPRNARYGAKFEDVTYESFCENVGMHLGGYFEVARQFAQFFSSQGCGQIVNMASIYGFIAPRFGIYSSSDTTMPVEYAAVKAGIIQLTKYLAQYYKSFGVRCNALAPGGVQNNHAPAFVEAYGRYSGSGEMLKTSDVADVLAFLLSDGARAINGQVLVVDQGWTL